MIEIRRERINVEGMTAKEIVATYGIPEGTAYRAAKQGWFIKNYRRKEVIINEECFNVAGAYKIALDVWNTNFRHYPKVANLQEDLVQESVVRMFELSGRAKEMADDKHNIAWHYYWIAKRTMRNYLKAWFKGERVLETAIELVSA